MVKNPKNSHTFGTLTDGRCNYSMATGLGWVRCFYVLARGQIECRIEEVRIIVQAMQRVVNRTPYGAKFVGKRAMRLNVGEASDLGDAMLLCSKSRLG